MAVPLQNDFEEGTNGTTITTGNSGGGTGSSNAFDSVVIQTGATVAFSNTQAAHGSLSMKVATGSSTSAAYVSWHSSLGSQTTIYGRFYLYLTATLPGATRLIEFWNGGDNATYCAGLDISPGGYMAIQNSSFNWVTNFGNPVAFNQWIRIEFKYTFGTSTGAATVNYYSSADSTTVTESHTVTGQNFGASTADTVDIGYAFQLANQPTAYFDSILINAVGFPGPATNSVQRNQISSLATGTGSSFTIPFTANNPTAGSKVIAEIALSTGASSVITSVVDNGTSPVTFTQDNTQAFTGSGSVSLWRGDSITLPASGVYTLTVTLASSQEYSAGAMSYTNIATGGPTAGNSSSGGPSSSPLTGFAQSSGKGALYISGYSSNSSNSETITATATGFVNEFTETAGSSHVVFAYTDKIDYAGPTNTQSTWTLSDSPYWAGIIAVYDIVATTVTGTGTSALQSFTFTSSGMVSGPSGTANLFFQSMQFAGTGTNTGATIFVNNVVTGNVLNDYGLDSVPYTVGTTGATTMLLAYIGWDVATLSYQNTGLSPAVNVTDSADNLWRQIGITTVSTSSRAAIWVADNPRQVSWVSVAVTGWAYATSYIICELDGVPSTLGSVALDFVKTVNGTAGTSLSLPMTATTNDIALGIVSTGGYGGGLTVPVNWLGIGAAGGENSAAATTYAMWTPNVTTIFNPTFNPTWSTSTPYSGILVGLKKSSTVPTQTNPNFPVIQVEAAFGATPGDQTQSVDYTWDVGGLTWTDITSRAFSKGDDAQIRIKRGRQYELSSEETGEIQIQLDNHDGAFTYGNTASPYYPNVIPGVPIRVTAWWGGVQYPVAFGYVERWPQEWPEMPQWGFSTLVATDAWGPLSSVNLPSAVEGDIKVTTPYAFFPTDEQYEFTTQSLTPVATPIDANGFIAVNKAFGNSRYAAYRDGTDQPVTVGQALNLLGDQDTDLGATTYTQQELGIGGPGLFYFDPNIPTNSSNNAFSVEFWFTWGNGVTLSNTYFSAWGKPSSYFVPALASAPTNGGVITVGVNTGNGNTLQTGLWVNGIEISGGTFNQVTAAPQHFVLTSGPNGTACYLNGLQTSAAPTLATIPSVRAVSLGPARFSYDVNNNVVYNGYNFVAGQLALYAQELTPQMIYNHYQGGSNGWVGVPAPGRFAQILTWGRLGLKRGGTAWYQTYGVTEDTYMSEAYQLEGSPASDAIGQVVQTERGRCFTQGNGSVIYLYRWYLYNQATQAVFGDNGTTELPFEQETSFSVDNQFIFNQVVATQSRGPNTDFYVLENNFPSQNKYFNRSGLSFTSYSMLPFDVFDVANWSMTKYNQPVQRVQSVTIDVSRIQAANVNAFPTILSLELNAQVTVNRRPVGGSTISVTGTIQELEHNIGAAYWHTTYQIAPNFPENNALIADTSGQDAPGSSYLSW